VFLGLNHDVKGRAYAPVGIGAGPLFSRADRQGGRRASRKVGRPKLRRIDKAFLAACSAAAAAGKDRSRSRKRPLAELGSGPTCRPRATWPAYGRPVKFKPTPCRAPTGCCQSRSGARRTCAPLVCAEFSDPRTLNRGFRRPIPLEAKACCFDAKGRVLEGLVRPAFCL
jgi:hypothetical protein